MNYIEHHPKLTLTEVPADVFEVRGAVIVGDTHVAVWDTLLLPDNMAGVAELAKDKTITVIYSHADWDHIWGTTGLNYEEVIAHETCKARFEDPADVEKTLKEKQAEDAQYNAVKLIAPTRSFQDSLKLELGNLELELHYLPGHSKDCTVAFIPALGVLLAGDCAEDPLPIVYEVSPLGAWIEKLEMWLNDPRVKTVIPSHGAVSDKELLERNITYLKALREGRIPDVPEKLHTFYSETHEANQKRAKLNS